MQSSPSASENAPFILIYILADIKHTPFTIRLASLTALPSTSAPVRNMAHPDLPFQQSLEPSSAGGPSPDNRRKGSWKAMKNTYEPELPAFSKVHLKIVHIISSRHKSILLPCTPHAGCASLDAENADPQTLHLAGCEETMGRETSWGPVPLSRW